MMCLMCSCSVTELPWTSLVGLPWRALPSSTYPVYMGDRIFGVTRLALRNEKRQASHRKTVIVNVPLAACPLMTSRWPFKACHSLSVDIICRDYLTPYMTRTLQTSTWTDASCSFTSLAAPHLLQHQPILHHHLFCSFASFAASPLFQHHTSCSITPLAAAFLCSITFCSIYSFSASPLLQYHPFALSSLFQHILFCSITSFAASPLLQHHPSCNITPLAVSSLIFHFGKLYGAT